MPPRTPEQLVADLDLAIDVLKEICIKAVGPRARQMAERALLEIGEVVPAPAERLPARRRDPITSRRLLAGD